MPRYHASTALACHEYLLNGFLSKETLEREGNPRLVFGSKVRPAAYDPDADCHVISCVSPEAALTYAQAYWGTDIGLDILEIEGDYPLRPIRGTVVPEGTAFLIGEVPPHRVRRHVAMDRMHAQERLAVT
jgi:hypothetical protein